MGRLVLSASRPWYRLGVQSTTGSPLEMWSLILVGCVPLSLASLGRAGSNYVAQGVEGMLVIFVCFLGLFCNIA